MEPMLLVMPLGAALVGAALGFAATRWIAPWLGWVLAALALTGAVVLALSGQGRPGFDGLGYIIVAVLMLAPGGLGAALGTVAAMIVAARARSK